MAQTTPPTIRPERSTNPWPSSTRNALIMSSANAPPRMATKAPPIERMLLVRMVGTYWKETLGTAFAPASALK